MDDVIIDVTDNPSFKLPAIGLMPCPQEVVDWPGMVETYEEFGNASATRRTFYYEFRLAFNNGEYWDLKGCINYVLILFYESVNKYVRKPDLEKLADVVRRLVDKYPAALPRITTVLKDRSIPADGILPPPVINAGIVLVKFPGGVEPWENKDIASYGEINEVAADKRTFYYEFREAFRRKEYLDLEGYNNYAFVLFFELVRKYLSHKNFERIVSELSTLSTCYPVLTPVWKKGLYTQMKIAGDLAGVEQLAPMLDKEPAPDVSQDNIPDGLGFKLREALTLSNEQVGVLNMFTGYTNTFYGIPFCQLAILRLFLAVSAGMNQVCQQTGSSLQGEIQSIANTIAQTQHNYRPGTDTYRYFSDNLVADIFTGILKCCENVVRERYGHKRKLSLDDVYMLDRFKMDPAPKLNERLQSLLQQLPVELPVPDQDTELALNAQNTTRWKSKMELIVANYVPGEDAGFQAAVHALAAENARNPSVEMIYFEATRFIAKSSPQTALKLYVHYIYTDLHSDTFDNRGLNKSAQKLLFTNAEQVSAFEGIIKTLIADRDLNKALAEVGKIYETKRKKIVLDTQAIQQAEVQYSGTVELLNRYLQDEEAAKGAQVEDTPAPLMVSRYIVDFQPGTKAVLDLFYKHNYIVSQEELDVYAKQATLFKSRLIDGVNESCYDLLEDVLIEEEGDNYIMNENYYQRLLQV